MFFTNVSYVIKCAAAFGERERIAIFLRALRGLFVREKDWNWSFALNFCFFLFKQKENIKPSFLVIFNNGVYFTFALFSSLNSCYICTFKK